MDKLDEWGEYEPWQRLCGIRDDKRMRGAELILRFLALTFTLDDYEKPLATFLNKFCQSNKGAQHEAEFWNAFKSAVDGIHTLFGEKAFRMLDDEGNPDNNFNAAVFDAQMVGFALSGRSADGITIAQRRRFVDAYVALQHNTNYFRSISASTSDPPLVKSRINLFRNLVADTLPA